MNKKERSEYMKQLGEKGGNATKIKHGISHFSTIGKKGQEALLNKIIKKNTNSNEG